MYESFYQCERTPFSREITTQSLYPSGMLEGTLGRLRYAAEHQLFAVLTGECGTGKTTLVRKLKESLDESCFNLLYLTDSKLTPRHFYNGLLSQLGQSGAFYRGDARRKLHHEIELILALILVGQSELWNRLELKAFAAIRQRIDILCRLQPLDKAETSGYIQSQLRYAGVERDLFTDAAIQEIYLYSTGIPRLINKLCTNCLLYGATGKHRIIDDHMVRLVIEGEMS
jgi:type II secretory pathway predicted ATPase ExeA